MSTQAAENLTKPGPDTLFIVRVGNPEKNSSEIYKFIKRETMLRYGVVGTGISKGQPLLPGQVVTLSQ